MKIQAGSLGGRSFEQPATRSVRPLSDKVRAAIFDVIGPVEGLSVLDAYAGSGAAGFEAISRGAVLVDAIESNPRVARAISSSAKSLGLDWGYNLHQISVETWLASPAQAHNQRRYHVVIADPPYAQLEPDIVDKLSNYLYTGGVLIVSRSSKSLQPQLEHAEFVKSKTYGDTAIDFFRAG